MNFNQLYQLAKKSLNSRQLAQNAYAGSVAAALLTDQGNVYQGVCLDLPCALGFCGEKAAVATMITAGENRIEKIVAVNETGIIIAPCGSCRELIRQIHPDNLFCEVMLSDQIVLIEDLLPHQWL